MRKAVEGRVYRKPTKETHLAVGTNAIAELSMIRPHAVAEVNTTSVNVYPRIAMVLLVFAFLLSNIFVMDSIVGKTLAAHSNAVQRPTEKSLAANRLLPVQVSIGNETATVQLPETINAAISSATKMSRADTVALTLQNLIV